MTMIEKYGVDTIKDIVEAILSYSEKRIRMDIEKFKKGTFHGESRVDDDGFGVSP